MSGVHVRVHVGSDAYALPVESVLEVDEFGSVAPVPGAPSVLLGLRNLRGQVLPVFDLASLFGLQRSGPAEHVLVAEESGRLAGFAVDQVADVGVLTDDLQEVDSELLVGAALVDGILVGVIDVPRLFGALEEHAA